MQPLGRLCACTGLIHLLTSARPPCPQAGGARAGADTEECASTTAPPPRGARPQGPPDPETRRKHRRPAARLARKETRRWPWDGWRLVAPEMARKGQAGPNAPGGCWRHGATGTAGRARRALPSVSPHPRAALAPLEPRPEGHGPPGNPHACADGEARGVPALGSAAPRFRLFLRQRRWDKLRDVSLGVGGLRACSRAVSKWGVRGSGGGVSGDVRGARRAPEMTAGGQGRVAH